MLRRLFILSTLFFGLSACTTTQVQDTLGVLLSDGPLTNAEVSGGLKQALELGIGKGSDRLSMVDGYFKSQYKILLPQEVRTVTDKLSGLPLYGDLENKLLEKINRGAEDAAKKAKPIFVNAIKSMSFSDAMNILMGEKDAATKYLNQATFDQLYKEFNPVIVQSLDKFKARSTWNDAATKYNSIPFVNPIETDLGDYVTRQALDGLFAMVAKEELNIRNNVGARTTDLLKKVFAKQDK